jgi:hypothetical protein
MKIGLAMNTCLREVSQKETDYLNNLRIVVWYAKHTSSNSTMSSPFRSIPCPFTFAGQSGKIRRALSNSRAWGDFSLQPGTVPMKNVFCLRPSRYYNTVTRLTDEPTTATSRGYRDELYAGE